MNPKAYVYGALAGLLALALWMVGNAIYEAGQADGAATCQQEQREADQRAREREQEDATSSDAATDTARRDGAQAIAESRGDTTKTIETIRYVYRDQPAPACPAPAVPDGVRAAILDAYDAAAAAAR